MIWVQRFGSALLLWGQVIVHLLRGRIHRRNLVAQLNVVGPESLLVVVLTGLFVGMVFTIQVAREFIRFGSGDLVGGVLALALVRELAPVLTAVIVTGRVGSAFAAELGTMRVTEQIDALYMLKTDPVDYLVLPRVLACTLMVPLLTVVGFVVGIAGGLLIGNWMYDLSVSQFLDSVEQFMEAQDLVKALIKGAIFGMLVATIGCSWGLTTTGGAKGVGQSTTASVVTGLLAIFISDFFLSWLMFRGLGTTAF
ncbi:MAG: MlaE family lipid ABC transporter permease subunit [Gloeomargarita sp. SKYG116]|nr:MlaE family lipid ABC transporter permease subunit [Gloeomargarita sp. SKYG116]MCS7226654.1 MlaE family lipid ABC transporter permease subunit [Gloeomargarita sp. SKYB31]MDW8400460.1 MlaE family lipid ABC transporter permease subunit [Gloeomargarita sp. SKYGB_i_bin116]